VSPFVVAATTTVAIIGLTTSQRMQVPLPRLRRDRPIHGRTRMNMSEQAVIITCNYGSTNLEALYGLEDRLAAKIEIEKVGEYDGNEIAYDGSQAILYMYGPDADKLLATIRPILETTSFMKGAIARVRYGPPEDGVPEIQVTLATT
jgi:hypothetical protein